MYKNVSLSLLCSHPQSHKYEIVLAAEDKTDIVIPIDDDFEPKIDSQTNNIQLGRMSDEEFWYLEVGSAINQPTIETFKLLLAQCIYEWSNKKPHSEASERELEEICKSITSLPQPTTTTLNLSNDVPLGEEVFKSTGNCSLFIFDRKKGVFVEKSAKVTVVIHKLSASKTGSFSYAMHLGNPSGRLHSQLIEPDISEHIDRGTCSFVWCYWDSDSALSGGEAEVQTLCLRWDSVEPLVAFSTSFGQFLWETKNKEAFYKLKQEDSEFLFHSYTHPMEIDDEDRSSDSSSDSDTEHYSDVYSEHELVGDPELEERAGSNQHLAIGYKNNRTFVSRGQSIGVFRSSSESANFAGKEDDLKFVTTIKSVQSLGGKTFNPEQLLLHDQDSSLLLRSSQLDPSKIYRMDLERGQVVDEWTAHPDTKLTSILPSYKNAQITPEQTLVGLSSNAIFRLDPRLPGNKTVEEEKKQYVVKSNFSCGTTTSVGELAVASEKGEIRLYDKLDKRAKSLIPGFGDPITGIDTLEDGKFIVATCRTYLLLINTQLDEGGKTGFSKSTTKGRKPPIRLQLRPEHVAYMGNKISFTTAHFSSSSIDFPTSSTDLMDRSIVTSTGPYVIIWSLGKIVKYGKLFDYQIRKYSDTVVADDFRFIGQDDSILVTLPHHVTVTDKESLVKPTAKAFMSSS